MSTPGKILLAIGLGAFGFVSLVTIIAVRFARDANQKEEQKMEALKAQRRAEQEAFWKTPEGQKAKAAELRQKNEADARALARLLLADSIEKNLLRAGLDVKTGVSEEKLTLFITGEPVNRVFVYRIMPTARS